VGRDGLPATTLFRLLLEEIQPESGSFRWGSSTIRADFPKDGNTLFDTDSNLVDWLAQFSTDKHEQFLRGWLGKMLFSGEESQKSARVLSGGEKVRCLLSRMMLQQGNVLILDEPTNHLDLESIEALNNALKEFPGTVLFTSQDHQFVQTVSNRIIELTSKGWIDRAIAYDEYLEDETIKGLRAKLYS
jgi:ATPase subunit of ABC transporter with duplicated ATPase domains